MKEIWKDIKEFEGKYQISSCGRVKSLGRIIGHGKGYFKPEALCKFHFNKDQYYMVHLKTPNRGQKSFCVHVLVGKHFVDSNPSPKHHFCHKDGNRLNNSAENIYCGDVYSNALDRFLQGRSKITLDQISEIKASQETQKVLAERYGVKQSYISRIKTGTRCNKILKHKSTLKIQQHEHCITIPHPARTSGSDGAN